ncbi:Ig-like domain-containing protein [bacterium]|nr:Ig-like domain-containing protein [bacterium]
MEVNEDGTASITLTGSDEEGDTLSFTVLSQPKNGTLSGSSPTLSYSPKDNYSGSDSFTYKANDGKEDSTIATVSISVANVNDKPEVANQSVDVDEDGSVSITLSGSDEEGDTLSFTVLSQPKKGKLSGTAPTLSYSPNANYSGSDSFTFKANDGKADSNTATVTINVIKKEADEPVLSLSKAEYEKGEVIKVSFSGGPGNAKDWLGLYKEGELNDDDDILKRLYVDGTEEGNDAKTEGVVSVEADLAPGSYQVSLFENDGRNILATVGFKVKKTGNNPDLEDNWTILVYGHADHNLGANLIGDLIEMEKVGSGDGLNIVAQTDFNPKAWERGNKFTNNGLIKFHNNIPVDIKNKVCRILVNSSNNWTFDSTPIEILPETENMDNPQTLSSFINWGIENYPAKKYGLVLWDHGGQYTGYGGDSQNGTYADFGFDPDRYGLKTKAIRNAIKSSLQSTGLNKFDFLTFDTCLMAGVEVISDFYDITDVFIACAEIDYGNGWDYGSLEYLKQNPEASTIDFAKQEVADWDKHHNRSGADIELRNHAAFDFSKYKYFQTAFIEFSQQITSASSADTQVITRARRDAIHYWLGGVSEMKKPTDYIDLGHFSLTLADSIGESSLKTSCLNLAASINDMVIAKSTGESRKNSLGLSIYYPYSGNVSWRYDDLNFFKEQYGGDVWLKLLDKAKIAKSADTEAPFVVVEGGNSSDTNRGKSFNAFNGVKIMASFSKPAIFNFSIDQSPDAYEAFASLVSNEETDNPNAYIYLGEVASIPLKGSGDYEFSWNGTLPVISKLDSDSKAPPLGGISGVDREGQEGEFPVYLGGWYIDNKSNTMISFIDYQPNANSEKLPLIFMTKFDDNGIGVIDTILYDNDDESWLSPTTSNVELEPGGKIWPIYYTEEITESGWEVYLTYFEDGYIIVPENGPDGLIVSWVTVTDGKYGIELQSFDNLGNESDITEFEVTIGSEGLPKLSLSLEQAVFELSWPMENGGDEVILQWSKGLGNEWNDVPAETIGFGGDGRIFKENPTEKTRFFRLVKR